MIEDAFGELSAALSQIDPLSTTAVLEALRRHHTDAIHVTGQGRSGLVSAMIAMRLMHLGMTAHVTGEPTQPAIGANDLLLVISGSGSTPTSLHFARIAHASGAQVVLVCRERAQAQIAEQAHLVLEIPAPSGTGFGGNMFEQGALIVLDDIVATIGADLLLDPAATLARRHTNLQ